MGDTTPHSASRDWVGSASTTLLVRATPTVHSPLCLDLLRSFLCDVGRRRRQPGVRLSHIRVLPFVVTACRYLLFYIKRPADIVSDGRAMNPSEIIIIVVVVFSTRNLFML